MLQAGSLGCRLRWSLTMRCLSGVPLGSTLWNQEERNRVRQRERSSWITGQTTLANPVWVWSDDGPSGLSWHVHWPGLYAPPWMGQCTQVAPRGAGGLNLPTGSSFSSWTTSPWREVKTARFHVLPWHVSQLQRWVMRVYCGGNSWLMCKSKDDLMILLTAFWSKK